MLFRSQWRDGATLAVEIGRILKKSASPRRRSAKDTGRAPGSDWWAAWCWGRSWLEMMLCHGDWERDGKWRPRRAIWGGVWWRWSGRSRALATARQPKASGGSGSSWRKTWKSRPFSRPWCPKCQKYRSHSVASLAWSVDPFQNLD